MRLIKFEVYYLCNIYSVGKLFVFLLIKDCIIVNFLSLWFVIKNDKWNFLK